MTGTSHGALAIESGLVVNPAVMSTCFVHLNLRTEFSLVDSIVRIQPLVESCVAAETPALAVTECGNLFSTVKFFRAASAAGLKPIVGADLALPNDFDPGQPARIILLCQNREGYSRLARLVSRTYVEGRSKGVPMLDPTWLEDGLSDLIALSGGLPGDVGQALVADRPDSARRRLERWLRAFPDRYYLEVHRTGRENEAEYVSRALELAVEFDVPVVATNHVRFLRPEDFEAHEARVCIQEGRTLDDPRRVRRYSEQQYLRSSREMAELFSDIPEALANSVEIARRCNLDLSLGHDHLPDFPVPRGTTPTECLRTQALSGLESRLEERRGAPVDPAPYRVRLDMELEVIVRMGFAGYFLIVADFTRWARENDVPVGPGRGSGAGSLVGYALGITDLDPIEHALLFERFLNPERVSLPDFDIDFCMDGRDRVIDYVAKRHAATSPGGERVAQIITFGTMAARAVVRDVGRVLGFPYGFVDQLAKLIPPDLGMTLERALQEEAFKTRCEEDEDARGIVELAEKLEGLARNAGRHAGGVVIAPRALTEYTALYRDQDGTLVTQFDKDDVEAIGLVKFDFLGLRTLTIIDRAVQSINAQRAESGEETLDLGAIPLEDPATYALIQRAATTAVFQLESRLCKDIIRRLVPDRFDDLTALNALIRPGPQQSGMVEDFINRKQGRVPVSYSHPDLEQILKPTYGVILYQEQVMQIAQVLAGYTLGGADVLRKAMGKKQPAEMAKQRAVFLDGARERKVDFGVANAIFDIMEKFAGYGFNRAHSAAYALIGYQTAWLKAHYPAAFMAAVLSSDMDNTDKIVVLVDECRELSLEIRPPDVNESEYVFAVAGPGAIRYGLGALKGMGQSAVAGIIEERQAKGPFRDLFDFCRRVDARRVNRRALEALIRAGALDGLGPSRASMLATLTRAMQAAEQHCRDAVAGQDDLFGGAAAGIEDSESFVEAAEWPEHERLRGEKETLGVYLTGHPITGFESELSEIISGRLDSLEALSGKNAIVAGLVVALRVTNSRKGRMAIVSLDDRSARIDAVVYAEAWQRYRETLVKDRLVILEGEVAADDWSGGHSVTVERVYDLEDARAARAKRIALRLDHAGVDDGLLCSIAEAMRGTLGGSTPVCIDYCRCDARVRMPLGDRWRVRPTDELLAHLKELAGRDRVSLEYQ